METKRLIETENSIQEFTVQFYGGTVMTEQNQLPLGQISCELLDYPVEERNRSIIPRTGKEKSLENGARKV